MARRRSNQAVASPFERFGVVGGRPVAAAGPDGAGGPVRADGGDAPPSPPAGGGCATPGEGDDAPPADPEGSELAPGAEMQITPPLDQFIAGSWKASANFGGAVRYDVAALLQALDRYPLWCLEQATSRGFPLALLGNGPLAGDDRSARLQQAVGFVLDRQRFDGGFGLWSASEEAEPWLSAYATEFLLRARDAGAVGSDRARAGSLGDRRRALLQQLRLQYPAAVAAYISASHVRRAA